MVLSKEAVTLEKNQVQALLNGFLKQFQNACNSKIPPNATEFEKYLSRNFQISNNGKVVENNLNGYMNRIQKFQKKYSQIKLSNLLDEPVIDNNQIAIHYEAMLTPKTGSPVQVYIMAIAVIENNKITEWKQASNEKSMR